MQVEATNSNPKKMKDENLNQTTREALSSNAKKNETWKCQQQKIGKLNIN